MKQSFFIILLFILSCSHYRRGELFPLSEKGKKVRVAEIVEDGRCKKIQQIGVKCFGNDGFELKFCEHLLKNWAGKLGGNVIANFKKPYRRSGWGFRLILSSDVFKCNKEDVQDILTDEINPNFIVFDEDNK